MKKNLLCGVKRQVSYESIVYFIMLLGEATGTLLVVVYSNNAAVENFTGLWVSTWHENFTCIGLLSYEKSC